MAENLGAHMLIHTAGENPNAGVHNAPIQQQQNKHWVFTPKQAQKEEFNKKRKEALGTKFPSHSAKERLHYVASHSVKLQI